MIKSARTLAARFWKDESGASMVEYVILISLVTIFLVAAIGLMSDEILARFDQITTLLNTAGT